jgi:hypothetical protein
MTAQPDRFLELANKLTQSGYQVMLYPTSEGFRFWAVSGKNIRGGFCDDTQKRSYAQLDSHFAADHEEVFDKWSKCPLVVPIDENLDFSELIKHLDFLGSSEGLVHSRSYEYLSNSKLPRAV